MLGALMLLALGFARADGELSAAKSLQVWGRLGPPSFDGPFEAASLGD
jgi:hypothetical protein